MDHCNDSAGHGHSGFTLSSQQRVKLGLMKVLYTTVFLMGLEYITVRKANKPLVQQSSQGFTSYLNLIYQTAARGEMQEYLTPLGGRSTTYIFSDWKPGLNSASVLGSNAGMA
ncbi:unnamed protein product [Fusarium graminearum]|uniref:Uncharacterized protein n=1 Tax=Gibberella zeae TaxID=5518 RepID=A0A4E9DZK2_GIBZA|nr:unnamed protein product [Fusarium graminearum]CAG1969397.1 unnamed protein product [Fusarium graminearum]CAG2007830.1 unnamed protein product [Fusarium graminearum]